MSHFELRFLLTFSVLSIIFGSLHSDLSQSSSLTDVSHFSIGQKSSPRFEHRQDRPVTQLDTNWCIFFFLTIFFCLTRSNWCPDLLIFFLIPRITLSYPLATTYGTKSGDTLNMRLQRNSSNSFLYLFTRPDTSLLRIEAMSLFQSSDKSVRHQSRNKSHDISS